MKPDYLDAISPKMASEVSLTFPLSTISKQVVHPPGQDLFEVS